MSKKNPRGICFSILILLVLVSGARTEACAPPIPMPEVWFSAGGAIGETAVLNIHYPGQNLPFVLAYSHSFRSVNPWPPLMPPITVLSTGNLDSLGNATYKLAVPPMKSLIGTPVYFCAAVNSNSWFYSQLCTWLIAPNISRRFVQASPSKPIPYNPGDGHARATLADGTILFCGGMVGGGIPNTRKDAYIYDPVMGTCVQVADMASQRYGHVCTALGDGTALVVGGDWNVSPTAELYDPTRKSWISLGAVPHYLSYPTATLVRDPWTRRESVLVAGGMDNSSSNYSAKAMLYDVQNRKFTSLPGMVKPRIHAAAMAFPFGAVLITGGMDTQTHVLADAEVFLLSTRKFHAWGTMTHPRYGHAMVPVGMTHALILGGGDRNGQFKDMELFDGLNLTSLKWSMRLIRARIFFNPVMQPDGSIVIAGGGISNTGYPGRVPELLAGGVSTILRPIAEQETLVTLQGLNGGGALALGRQSIHHFK